MENVSVQIVRLVSPDFPGWVEADLVDADGRLHTIRDKVPIFATELLDADSEYPAPGVVRCEIVRRFRDEKGRDLVRICTKRPDGIESTAGLQEFTVMAALVNGL